MLKWPLWYGSVLTLTFSAIRTYIRKYEVFLRHRFLFAVLKNFVFPSFVRITVHKQFDVGVILFWNIIEKHRNDSAVWTRQKRKRVEKKKSHRFSSHCSTSERVRHTLRIFYSDLAFFWAGIALRYSSLL